MTIILRDVELLWLDKPVLSDGGGDSATYNMMTTAAEVCTPELVFCSLPVTHSHVFLKSCEVLTLVDTSLRLFNPTLSTL